MIKYDMNMDPIMKKQAGVFPKTYVLFFVLLLTSVGLCFLQAPCMAALKRPMVALLPIKSVDKTYSYVGPALTQMLDTRLASEGIDSFIVSSAKDQSDTVKLADFVVTGKVQRDETTFNAKILLKEPGNGEVLKTWDLKAVSLDMLAQNVALFSVKLADTIKHAEDILIQSPEEVGVNGNNQGGTQASDEFAMARMHPDILVREQLVKDEEKERELEQQKAQEQKRLEEQRIQAQKKEPEEWFPLPDVYDPETDEPPKAEPEEIGEANVTSGDVVQATTEKATEQDDKHWYSKLWPFGKKEKEQRPSWEKEREKLRAEQKRHEHVAKVVPADALPYPPPPKIQFDIPEPVPVDEALRKIDQIYVTKPVPKEEKGWLSKLWPWEEEEQPTIPEKGAAEQGAIQASISPNSEVHKDMNQMINSLSRGSNNVVRDHGNTKENPSGQKGDLSTQKIQQQTGTSDKEANLGIGAAGQMRQEHVYFEPRLRPEEPEGQSKAVPTEHGMVDKGQSFAASAPSTRQAEDISPSSPQQPDTNNPVQSAGNQSQMNQANIASAQVQKGQEDSNSQGYNSGNTPIWRWY